MYIYFVRCRETIPMCRRLNFWRGLVELKTGINLSSVSCKPWPTRLTGPVYVHNFAAFPENMINQPNCLAMVIKNHRLILPKMTRQEIYRSNTCPTKHGSTSWILSSLVERLFSTSNVICENNYLPRWSVDLGIFLGNVFVLYHWKHQGCF